MGKIGSKPQLVICDFDNTLVDTERPTIKLFVDFFREGWGIQANAEDQSAIYSVAFVEVFRYFRERFPVLENLSDTTLGESFLDYKDEQLSGAHIATADGYTQLVESSHSLALVSGSHGRELSVVARAAGIDLSRFSPILSSDMYYPWKPDPAGFNKAADLAGVPPSSCVVIEDSIRGLQAAASANMCCVHIREFSEAPQDLVVGLADHSFGTIRDFAREILKKRNDENV